MKISETLGMPSFQESRAVAVANILRDAIITGKLQAGQRLDLNELSKHFNFSRMPIREAIKQLETEGLLNVYPHRGVEVSSLNGDELEELFSLRIVLEQKAIERSVVRLSDQDLEEMKAVLEEIDSLGENNDAWLALNRKFHEIINNACGWPRLIEMINTLRSNVDRYIRLYVADIGHELPQSQHWALYEALCQRDATNAKVIIADHINDTAQKLLTQLRERV